jgi:hypothetical protein
MNDPVETTLENLRAVFRATDQALSEWTEEGNLQFPKLFAKMALALNWNEDQVREADPFIRHYIRNHPDWHVTRGSGGGIMRRSDKLKKESVRLAKEQARQQVEAALAAKLEVQPETASTQE